MTQDIFMHNGYIYDPSISKLENDWLAVLPASLRRPSWLCLQDTMSGMKFNNAIERNKAKECFMIAFATAMAMAIDERKTNDKAKEEVSKAEGLTATEVSERFEENNSKADLEGGSNVTPGSPGYNGNSNYSDPH